MARAMLSADGVNVPAVISAYGEEADVPVDGPVVYVLGCGTRDSYDAVKSVAMDRFGFVPSWAYPAYTADRRYYVGSTGNVVRRVAEHCSPAVDGAVFTTLFPPAWLEGVVPCRDIEAARNVESAAARKLREKTSAFVYQR